MSTQARIKELDNRHTNLEAQIEEELKHPSCDTLLISELKKQKLHLKEQMADLQQRH